jgi:DNA-binding protein HU-beta
MNKADVVDRVASKSGLSKRDATKAVDAFLDSVSEALRSGEAVSFSGFGKFSSQERKERQGVNPRTKERVQIPAAKVPKFSAGSALKESMGARAAELRKDAAELERSHEAFSGRLAHSRRALREIAQG